MPVLPTPPGNNSNNKKGNWSRNSKTWAFWILLATVPVVFFEVASTRADQPAPLIYSQYDQQLAQDNVRRVTIQSGRQLTGEFKQKVVLGGKDVQKFTVKLPLENSDEEIDRLRAHNVELEAKEPSQTLGTVVQILPYLVLVALWIFFIRQMQAGGNKAFSFGKSKAKLLTGDTPKVTFADVAGADEAKVELQEIIEFLKDPQKFTKLGGRLPKGALLVGPPGTGKTLLARAVAGEAGRPFFSMSGSDFVEMFVGVGASRVRDLFEQGKAHAPCIIFIDEIDAVGRHRGAGLGGGQGRRPFLRRRVRHHPFDAARCCECLSLDDRRPVPECRRPGSSHARTSGVDHCRRGLRRGRHRRCPARDADGLRAVVSLCALWRTTF